ncbi:alpha/beta hydrolase [Altererythrobacter sp. MF3-039]|uniref:alpha/beta hydrolase n=1 Tax=Altererythrobacter sp. MF3-039 TaxID=3252901 RepID=UPI00390C72C5
MWFLIGIVVALAVTFIALQIAIARDGPAVLSNVDRITGGSQGAELLERARYGEDPAQKLRVWRKTGTHSPMPMMIFVHGGSWSWGDPDSYDFIGRNFAAQDFVTVVAGYRLYPDVRYPAMLEDSAAAVRWARENAARLGGDHDRIWLMGHSAGAYNVVGIALDPRWLEAEGVPEHALAGVIGISGPYDFYPFNSESTRNSFGEWPDPEATQPISYARGDAAPLLLLTGYADTTVKPRNSKALARAIETKGGAVELEIYSDMEHSDPLIALANPWRDRREVMARILAFTGKYAQHTQSEAANPSLAVQADSR